MIRHIMKPLLIAIMFCLPFLSYGQARDCRAVEPVSHAVGVDIRPSVIAQTDDFFMGNNSSGKPQYAAGALHLKYSLMNSSIRQGIGVGVHPFFNNAETGTPVSLYIFQGARIAKLSESLSIDYEWNFGASFGWKPFDEVTNPYNDVVGSKVNAYLNAGIMLSWRPDPQWTFTFGLDASHFSNGNTGYPNLGVNTLGLRAGAVRKVACASGRLSEFMTSGPIEKGTFKDRLTCDLVLYGAVKKHAAVIFDDVYVPDGYFGVAGINVNPMCKVSSFFRAGISLDIQYDESSALEGRFAGVNDQGDIRFYLPPLVEQFTAGLSLRAELVMPVFSVNLGVGYDLYDKNVSRKNFYQVAALKASVTPRLFIHIGYRLYDFSDPDNLMLGLGWRFGRTG